MSSSYAIGINTTLSGKANPTVVSTPGFWTVAQKSLQELAEHISNGFPWMPALLDGDTKRNQQNSNFAAVLGADVDNGLTIQDALKHPFIKSHCGLLIESASSKSEHHKFRLVFPLVEPLTNWMDIRLANQFILHQLKVADPACKDASRFFWGAPGRSPHLLNDASALPADFLRQATDWRDAEESASKSERDRYLAQFPTDDNRSLELAKQAITHIPAYKPGSNTYGDLIAMCFGVLEELGTDGELLLEAWGGFGPGTARKISGMKRSSGGRTAGLGSLFYLAKQHGFKIPKSDRQPKGDQTSASAGSDSSPFILLDGGKTSPKVSRTLKSDILTAMDEGLSGSDLEARKLQVASANGIPAQTLGILWRQIEKEIEQQEGRSAQSDEIESLLSKKAQRLDISQILPESLAGPLKRRAELLGSTPEILLTTLLPVIASQAKIGTKLHLSRGSEWEALPIFWSGIVGEPATAKSPSLNVFFKPLRAIQGRAINRYKEEMKYFEKLEEKGEDVPEKALRYLVDDVTIESLARIQDEQPDHGCLIGVDELAGFVNSLGQYKGGKGSDKQKVLGIRDGKGFSVSRSGKDDIMTSSSSFSICGAIQPGVLAQQMGDFTDTDGYWSRFCWCLLPLLRKQLETPEKDAAIAQKLRHDIEFILGTVKSFHPLGYELSPEAKVSCEAFREEMEDRRMDHPNNTMKIVHGKVQGQVGEVALILHLLWGTYGRGSIPDIFVSDQTMQRAIEVIRFFIVQAELIQALGEEVQGGESGIYTKMIELSHKKGWVKASDASKSVRAIKDDKQKDGNYVRVLFLELEAMGKGELKGKGRSLEFKAFTGAKVSIDESPLSYPGWTLTDIQELRDALKANPDSSEGLRLIVPQELWSQIGIAA